MSDTVELFTDGACKGNPGPGGWGALLVCKGVEKELWGGEANTTNNRMELLGAIRGLEELKRPCEGTGEKRRSVETAGRAGQSAQRELEVGARAHWPPGQRTRRPVGEPRRG
jgi:hypothetical protein